MKQDVQTDEFRPKLESFVKEHLDYLRSIANRLAPELSQADDLVQETLLIALKKSGTFNASREIRPWLAGILRNLARKAWSRAVEEKRLRRDALARYMEEISENPSGVFSDEKRVRLEYCLGKLAERARQLLNLRYTVGMRSEDIAGEVGATAAAVRVSLGRIRQRLRECIEGAAARGSEHA